MNQHLPAFHFIYTPGRYKLQINNFSVFMLMKYGCGSNYEGEWKIISGRISGKIE